MANNIYILLYSENTDHGNPTTNASARPFTYFENAKKAMNSAFKTVDSINHYSNMAQDDEHYIERSEASIYIQDGINSLYWRIEPASSIDTVPSFSYEELCSAYHDDPIAVTMAITALTKIGTDAILDGSHPLMFDTSNLISLDIRERATEYTSMLATTVVEDASIFYAFMSREFAPKCSDAVPPLHAFGDEEGVCPVCGSGDLEYEAQEVIDNGGVIPWTCNNCGATGGEGFDRVFDRHYNVHDADGKKLPDRD